MSDKNKYEIDAMSMLMTVAKLNNENLQYQNTAGISQNNRSSGFIPAFCDTETGRVELSCLTEGIPAPVHLLCGVPDEWVVSRNMQGEVMAIKASVIAGFCRDGVFFTREQAASAVV
ncbi:hypothetical protein ACFVYJ_02720 [Pontibacter sp. JAM-7]|uniref:hypothetical protein n=1 Tax=Pontibacter sp. JAM-7 TaxID=3366581 RepID=UPI003AF5A5AD